MKKIDLESNKSKVEMNDTSDKSENYLNLPEESRFNSFIDLLHLNKEFNCNID